MTRSSPTKASRDESAWAPRSLPAPALQLANAPVVVRYVAAFALTVLAAAVAVAADSQVTIPNLSLVFVVPVVISAVFFGLDSSLFSAILGALAYNYFLTEPRYSLAVSDPSNIWAIALFFVVGCIVSGVASTARRRADDAARLWRQVAGLQVYARRVVAAKSWSAILSNTAGTLEALFHVPVVVMTMSQTGLKMAETRGQAELGEAELEAARSALGGAQETRAGVYPFDASRFDFWPVVSPSGRQAVLGLAFDPDERPAEPGILVEMVASVVALALDRDDLPPVSAPQSVR